MRLEFRDLRADEIDVRVGQINEKGATLLLYKDARVDMDILDETVGPMDWQRSHLRDNANCAVSIWDSEKGQWIVKEDTGTESNTEKEKGLASDSFKRACFNWGIGRELYTAPFIYVPIEKIKAFKDGGKVKTYDKFMVSNIKISDKKITAVEIKNNRGEVVFAWKQGARKPAAPTDKKTSETTAREQLYLLLSELNIDVKEFAKANKINKQTSDEQIEEIVKELKKGA